MKILFYSYSSRDLPSYSGIHVHEVLSGLVNLGHTVFFADGQLFTNNIVSQPVTKENINNSKVTNFLRFIVKKMRVYHEALFIMQIKNQFKLFLQALKTAKTNKPDIVYSRHGMFNSEYLLAKLLKIPLVCEVNGIVIDEALISGNKDWLMLKIIAFLERRSIKKSDKLITVTKKLGQVAHGDYGVELNKITVIENGANTKIFKPLDQDIARGVLKMNKTDQKICFVGTLAPWQGVDYLIAAMSLVIDSISNAKLIIVGSGIMEEELINLANEYKISDKVIFFGKVPYDKVPLYINASCVCVVPKKPLRSGYSPLKLCEYMACKKPVVATRVDGFEVLEQYKAGLLVPPEDAQQLAAAIIILIQNAELRNAMGENGYKYVVENRSWESVAKKVEGVFKEAIQS